MTQGAAFGQSGVEAEIDRLERDFYRIYAHEHAALDAIVARARATGDAALIGRSLSLAARAHIGRGQHDAAVAAARAGLAAFATLAPAAAEVNRLAGAELLRACGSALLKLGRLGEALPLLENAVGAAEAAYAADGLTPAAGELALHALVRCLNNLGGAFIAVREIDAAIDVYHRLATVADPRTVADPLLDDVLLAQWNFADALHERVRRGCLAGDPEGAAADMLAVDVILRAAGSVVEGAPPSSPRISAYARQGYYATSGRHLMLGDRPAEALRFFEQQIEAVSREPDGGMYDWVIGIARAGMAEAALNAGLPSEALRYSTLALEHFDRHDEATDRAAALRVRAAALHALGEHEAAYAQLAAYNALRERLEAVAAQHDGRDTIARLGLERARAEAESQRRIAATLETLGRIGQEITANLDVDAVVAILHRHVRALLHAPSFSVWLLDAGGETLTLAFGIEDGRAFGPSTIRLDHPRSNVALAVRERREIHVIAAAAGESGPALVAGTRFLQSALFVPLCVGERVLGVLSIQSDRPAAYGENERSMVRTLSTYGAIALDNAAAYRELGRAVASLQEMQRELALRTAQFERLSMTDALTGVPNRRHFNERAAIESAEARRNHGLLAVAIFDLDRFKDINDRHGHAVGDHVLQSIAHVAKEALRPADFLARIGGEEFALLLPGAGRIEAGGIAERIRAAIAKLTLRAAGDDVAVTASFGVADYGAGDAFEAAFARADRALYRAKQNGRNRVESD